MANNNAACISHAKFVHRVAVIALAFVACGAPVGCTILTMFGKQIPEAMTTMGGAAIGALVTLLTTTGRIGHR